MTTQDPQSKQRTITKEEYITEYLAYWKKVNPNTLPPTKKDASKQLDMHLAFLEHCILNNTLILFRNFGKFGARVEKERQARNPQTGEKLTVAAKRIPYLRFSNALRDRLNSK